MMDKKLHIKLICMGCQWGLVPVSLEHPFFFLIYRFQGFGMIRSRRAHPDAVHLRRGHRLSARRCATAWRIFRRLLPEKDGNCGQHAGGHHLPPLFGILVVYALIMMIAVPSPA